MFLLCRVWLAPLEILGPMGPLDRKWVTNEPLFSCFIDLSVRRCQAAVQTFGMVVRATVHKPIPHDKWDLILQVFSVISVGNWAPTSVLIRLNIAGSSVLISVMWWAGGMLTWTCCVQLNFNWTRCFITCFHLCSKWIYLHLLGWTWKDWTSWSSRE